jgi:hypothetical protein
MNGVVWTMRAEPPIARQASFGKQPRKSPSGPLPLHLADIHLARLFQDKAELAKARELIEKHGYRRRNEESEAAEAAAKNWPA